MDVTLLDGIEDLEAYVDTLDASQKLTVLNYLKQVENYKRYNKLEFFSPEEWQTKAVTLGASETFRMVSAGNRLGKSYFSTYETAVHATGRYPKGWTGLRYDKPLNILVMGWDWSQINRPKCTAELLLGTPDDRGSGWIPKDDIQRMVPKLGMQNTVASVFVKHYDAQGNYDGDTRIIFDVYSAGMGTLMGMSIDFALLDEQVPVDIFSQVKKRLWDTRGSCLYVATPEHGMDEVIKSFWEDDGVHHSGLVHVTLWDSSLFTTEEKQKMNAEIEPWARGYSIEGIPSAGSGAVFAGILKESILEPNIEIKDDWIRMSAADLGFKDDMAFTFMAKDPSTGIYYLYAEKGFTQTDAIICAQGVKPMQEGFIPMILPTDGDSERGLGATYRSIFEGAGLIVTEAQARNWMIDPEGKDRTIKSGVMMMRQLMKEGRFFVHPSCAGFLREFNLYSYDKDGKFLDKDNHYCDSVRYCLMAIDKFGVSKYAADHRSSSSLTQSDWQAYFDSQNTY